MSESRGVPEGSVASVVFAGWPYLPIAWSVYFVAKLFLHLTDYLYLTVWPNLGLLAFAVTRVPTKSRFRRTLIVLKAVVGLALGFGLAWRESWLPSLGTLLEFLADEAYQPGVMYMADFVQDFLASVRIWPIFMMIILAAAGRRFKVPTTVLIAVLLCVVVIVTKPRGPMPTLDDVAAVWDAEADRRVRIPDSVEDRPPFDIIFLHICSLSWDDLRLAGMDSHPVFDQFDYWLTRFNSATAYSEQSAYRLLRSTCGQTSNAALHREAPDDCYLLSQLRDVGYETYSVLNHDDLYDKMGELLEEHGRTDPIMDFDGLPATWISYDGSRMFDDFATLEKWWRLRRESTAPRALLYYNTLTLHDGVHRANQEEWWKVESLEHFQDAAATLFAAIERFLGVLEEADHPALVIFIPEHGSAIRSTRVQMSTLRELPLPSITRIPVGLRFTGVDRRGSHREPRSVDTKVSYQAIAYLLSRTLERPPFDGDWTGVDAAVETMPETPFLSDNNAETIVLERDEHYFLYVKGRWVPLPEDTGR